MARAARIALDIALVSIKKIRPVITSVWGMAKSKIMVTGAKNLVDNRVVNTIENTLDSLTTVLESKMAYLRDMQLPREQRYLEKELQKVKIAGRTLRSEGQIAWSYMKVECVPPMTMAFFNGPAGQKIENSVSSTVNGVLDAIEKQINAIDTAEENAKKAKEAAILAAQEKIRLAELKKREEAAKKAADAKKAQEKKAAAKQKTEATKADAKKTDDKKDVKKEPPKPKKVEKKDPKKK